MCVNTSNSKTLHATHPAAKPTKAKLYRKKTSFSAQLHVQQEFLPIFLPQTNLIKLLEPVV